MIGVAALTYSTSPETITALGEWTVAPFDRTLPAMVTVRHPRLPALMLALTQVERVVSTDPLAAVGRASAKARIAALLLHLRDRMRQIDGTVHDSFAPGVTQEEIGDATGLTAVHVDPMLRQLEDHRLIARGNGRIAFLDKARLVRLSAYVNRLAGVDSSWLPAPA